MANEMTKIDTDISKHIRIAVKCPVCRKLTYLTLDKLGNSDLPTECSHKIAFGYNFNSFKKVLIEFNKRREQLRTIGLDLYFVHKAYSAPAS
jgi:hypothetical protein